MVYWANLTANAPQITIWVVLKTALYIPLVWHHIRLWRLVLKIYNVTNADYLAQLIFIIPQLNCSNLLWTKPSAEDFTDWLTGKKYPLPAIALKLEHTK